MLLLAYVLAALSLYCSGWILISVVIRAVLVRYTCKHINIMIQSARAVHTLYSADKLDRIDRAARAHGAAPSPKTAAQLQDELDHLIDERATPRKLWHYIFLTTVFSDTFNAIVMYGDMKLAQRSGTVSEIHERLLSYRVFYIPDRTIFGYCILTLCFAVTLLVYCISGFPYPRVVGACIILDWVSFVVGCLNAMNSPVAETADDAQGKLA